MALGKVDAFLSHSWHDDPQVRAWTDYAIGALCSSVGVCVALHFERLVFTASNAVVGAELLMAPLLRELVRRGVAPADVERTRPVMALKYSICAVGVQQQFFGHCRALPVPLHLALWGPLFFERWLVGLASIAVRHEQPCNRHVTAMQPPCTSPRLRCAEAGR